MIVPDVERIRRNWAMTSDVATQCYRDAKWKSRVTGSRWCDEHRSIYDVPLDAAIKPGESNDPFDVIGPVPPPEESEP